jgi:hypothetical protein
MPSTLRPPGLSLPPLCLGLSQSLPIIFQTHHPSPFPLLMEAYSSVPLSCGSQLWKVTGGYQTSMVWGLDLDCLLYETLPSVQ